MIINSLINFFTQQPPDVQDILEAFMLELSPELKLTAERCGAVDGRHGSD